MDKAYGYTPRSAFPPADSRNVLIDVSNRRPYAISQSPPAVVRLVGHSNIQCFSRVVAPKGFYAIPAEAGAGNSYICFKLDPDEGAEWVAGQIQHIFEHGGILKMAIKRSVELRHAMPDPFAAFWKEGFQAKTVSSRFSNHLEIVDANRVLAHTVRWELIGEIAVVLNLYAVRAALFLVHLN